MPQLKFGENRKVIGWREVTGKEIWSERSVRKSYDQVNGVISVVSRKINMLSWVKGEKKQFCNR